ncbi:hypothetical protein ACJX0J_031718, partial [Zea mays]
VIYASKGSSELAVDIQIYLIHDMIQRKAQGGVLSSSSINFTGTGVLWWLDLNMTNLEITTNLLVLRYKLTYNSFSTLLLIIGWFSGYITCFALGKKMSAHAKAGTEGGIEGIKSILLIESTNKMNSGELRGPNFTQIAADAPVSTSSKDDEQDLSPMLKPRSENSFPTISFFSHFVFRAKLLILLPVFDDLYSLAIIYDCFPLSDLLLIYTVILYYFALPEDVTNVNFDICL